MPTANTMDQQAIIFISGILILLVIASLMMHLFNRRFDSGIDASILHTCQTRLRAWWILFGLLICFLLLGTIATTFLFFIISFWAMREYLTLAPTRPADHQVLFWILFLLTPVQFILVGINDEWFRNFFGISSYQVYSILLPAYAFLILPAWIAASNDSKGFLERVAKIQVGLVICVYSLSFAPALLTTTLPLEQDSPPVIEVFATDVESRVLAPVEKALTGGMSVHENGETSSQTMLERKALEENASDQTNPPKLRSGRLCLLVFFVFIVQMSDIFQYLWSQFFRSGVIAPAIHSHRTWPGVFAGALSTSLLALGLWYFTPFKLWWQPVVTGFVVSLMGFAGSMTMSAIKRDRGVDDYGTLIEGHNGILDRIDSLCFAAPVFFHLVWLFLNLEIRPF